MITTLILATILHARAELIARSIIYGLTHDHPAIEFDRCLRYNNRSRCVRERDANVRQACRFIRGSDCTL